MISPGSVGCGGMTMLLSSSREIKISGKKSFVWFKGSLPFWGVGMDLLKTKVSFLAGSTATLGIQAKTMQDIRNSRKWLLPII